MIILFITYPRGGGIHGRVLPITKHVHFNYTLKAWGAGHWMGLGPEHSVSTVSETNIRIPFITGPH